MSGWLSPWNSWAQIPSFQSSHHPTKYAIGLFPDPAILWLRKALKYAIGLRQVARPRWNDKFARYNLELQISSNLRGWLLWIVEILTECRFVCFCITGGFRSSGWSLFEHILINISVIWEYLPSWEIIPKTIPKFATLPGPLAATLVKLQSSYPPASLIHYT